MASPKRLKKVADSTSRGKNHLPGPGVSAGALKKPGAAPQSGKKGSFPASTKTAPMPLRKGK